MTPNSKTFFIKMSNKKRRFKMLIKTKEKGFELLYRSIPYPDQIRNIDVSIDNVIYFEWRSQKYKLDFQFCTVEKCTGVILVGDDCSILMTRCLRNQLGTIL